MRSLVISAVYSLVVAGTLYLGSVLSGGGPRPHEAAASTSGGSTSVSEPAGR